MNFLKPDMLIFLQSKLIVFSISYNNLLHVSPDQILYGCFQSNVLTCSYETVVFFLNIFYS